MEAQLEKDLVLNWLQERAKVTYVTSKDASEDDVSELLGESPEELAKRVLEEEKAQAASSGASPTAPAAAAASSATPATTSEAPATAPEDKSAKKSEPPAPAPNGFEWGATF